MRQPLRGIFGPITTPFDPDTGDLAAAPLRANVRAHLAAGLDGLVVAGSTGEAALLDEAERRRLLEWVRAETPDDRWCIAGIGAESTRLTIQRARDAAERGADAVLVVSPHYYGAAMTRGALSAHFTRVADASPLPVLLYNIPKYAHLTLMPDLVAELARHGNVAGIKDSSGDLTLLSAYLEAQSDGFSVLTGNAATLYPALDMGARGGILAAALFAPALSLEIGEARDAGDAERAAAAQERLVPLARTIVGAMGVAGVKAALDLTGHAGGPVRPPLRPLSSGDRHVAGELVRAAGLCA